MATTPLLSSEGHIFVRFNQSFSRYGRKYIAPLINSNYLENSQVNTTMWHINMLNTPQTGQCWESGTDLIDRCPNNCQFRSAISL